MGVVRLLRTSIIQIALIRATERECIPRDGGALAGQLGRCLKTIDEKGLYEDRVHFFKPGSAQRCHRLKAEQWYFSLKSEGFHSSEKKSVMMGLTVAEIFNIPKEEQTITL